MALLVVVAIVLIWIGATRDSAAQTPGTGPGAGRFALSLTTPGAGSGYYAILLDTQTGRMWSSAGTSTKIHEFEPLRGPMDPHRPATDKPEAAPQP
jgi:hypothetical protein